MYRLICRYQEHMVVGNTIALTNNTANSHSNIMKLRSMSCQEDITVPLTGVKVVTYIVFLNKFKQAFTVYRLKISLSKIYAEKN